MPDAFVANMRQVNRVAMRDANLDGTESGRGIALA
jgi:hypothetical protein